jgi:adenosylhomocysteinase
LTSSVHGVPKEIEDAVAIHKLESMGITIDVLTTEQRKYMTGWEQGT